MGMDRLRYMVVGIVWILILASILSIFYALYAVISPGASNPTGLLLTTTEVLRQTELVYNGTLVIICLFCGLGIVRLK